MEFINLSDIQKTLDDFIFAKRDIENDLLEKNVIEERYNLTDFITNLHIDKSIFMYKGSVIPFKIVNGKEKTYIFYTASHPNNEKRDLQLLTNKLDTIQYDLSKLEKKNTIDFMQSHTNINDMIVFVLDNDYYV